MSVSALNPSDFTPFSIGEETSTQSQTIPSQENDKEREVAKFLELLTQLENENYEIPKDYEQFFTAPLNRELIERDYNIWKRLITISSNFFSQFAFMNKAIGSGAALFSTVLGIGINKYPQVLIGTFSVIFGGYYGIKEIATSILGKDSFKARIENCKLASSEESYSKAFAKRFSLFSGTNSIEERIGSIVKGTLLLALASVGYDAMSQNFDNPWTSWAVTGLEAVRSWIFPLIASGLGIGISFAALMTNWHFQGQAMQKINRDISSFTEDMKFTNDYERLLDLSDEEYLSELCSAMGLLDYDMLKNARLEYRAKIFETLKNGNYSIQKQLIVDPLEALSKVSGEYSENSLKPVVAQISVLAKEKEKILDSYKTLISLNQLPEAYQVLNEQLKPLIFKLEFLKQTLLDPTRPQMGMLAPNGGVYRSYLSMLIGKEVNYPLQSQMPETYELEAKLVLFQEAVLQKKFFHIKGKQELAELFEQIKNIQDVNSKA